MSATDELRALLDDAGVEYKTANFGNDEDSIWFDLDDKREVGFDVFDGGVTLTRLWRFTPAQVIEATFGRGECHDLAETPDYRDKTDFKCSECGYEYSSIGGFGCDCGDEPDFNFCPNCGRRVVT